MITIRDTRTALDAYMEHYAAALALIERIHEAVESHDISPDPETINWCHVGDMDYTEKQLRAIADHLFSEGEHAPDAE